MSTTTQNRQEARRLLLALKAAGWHPSSVSHEERVRIKDLRHALEEILACDDCTMHIKHHKLGKASLYLVLGNGPGELVSDGTARPECLWQVIREWSDGECARIERKGKQ